MRLEEKYFLIVIGTFEKEAIPYDYYPTEEEIINTIAMKNGQSARIEKRFVLTTSEQVNV